MLSDFEGMTGYDFLVKTHVKATVCDTQGNWTPVTLSVGERLMMLGHLWFKTQDGKQSGQFQMMSNSRLGVLRVQFEEFGHPKYYGSQ